MSKRHEAVRGSDDYHGVMQDALKSAMMKAGGWKPGNLGDWVEDRRFGSKPSDGSYAGYRVLMPGYVYELHFDSSKIRYVNRFFDINHPRCYQLAFVMMLPMDQFHCVECRKYVTCPAWCFNYHHQRSKSPNDPDFVMPAWAE